MKFEQIVVVFLFFASVGLFNSAFADHPTATISIPEGTGVPGCEDTDECYLPFIVAIDVGGEITWSNDDTAAHTVTSGTAADGPDGIFDSGLFIAGNTFSVKFDDYDAGDYPYFCMVHPWMTGTVIVQAEAEEEHAEEQMKESEALTGFSTNGGLMVKVWLTPPTENERMNINTEIAGAGGEKLVHANYDLKVIQNGEIVLDDIGGHFHDAKGTHLTAPLKSSDPVDIEITLQGMGNVPIEQRAGPVGDTIVFSSVVPEFGTIAMVILGISIVSIIAISAKTKAIMKLGI